MDVLYLSNTNVIEINELYDTSAESYLNSATVTVTLEDKAGTEVTGETWPKTMSYVSASNGKYRATLASGIGITAGKQYIAKITATESGNTGYWEVPLVAHVRSA